MRYEIGDKVVISSEGDMNSVKYLLRTHICRVIKVFSGERQYSHYIKKSSDCSYLLECRDEDNPGRELPVSYKIKLGYFKWIDSDFVPYPAAVGVKGELPDV